MDNFLGEAMASGMEKLATDLGLKSPIELIDYLNKSSNVPIYMGLDNITRDKDGNELTTFRV